jgi:type IV pilus assembly protein PilW
MMRPDVKSLRTAKHRESGFTIVELMVGMLIGLIAIVVMFQVFAVSEGQRRTTAGAGDAQQNGVTSLYLMERDARLAGYGINFFRLLGCTVNAYYKPAAAPLSFALLPVVIQNGATGAPDSITFVYSDTDSYAFPSILSNPTSASAAGYLRIRDDRFPYKRGDLFVVGEIPPPPATSLTKSCSLFQVTDLPTPATGGDSTQITFSGANYVDDSGVTRSADYTPPTASSSAQLPPNNVYYSAWNKQNAVGGRIFNFGNRPTVVQYSIVNNQLVTRDLLRPDLQPTPISDDIVQLQAQYGYSAHDTFNGAATVGCLPLASTLAPCTISPSAASVSVINLASNLDQWGDSVPATMTPSDWRRVVAMRFVVVARSGQREKVNPSTGVCDATTTLPVWSATSQTIDITANPDWQCYRYKTFQGIVPMRNFLYFPDPNGTGEAPA